MAAGEHLVQANVGELPETVSKWTYYMELIHIYIAPELGICQNMSDVTPMGPSQNICLTEMRDLISATALGSVFQTLIAV